MGKTSEGLDAREAPSINPSTMQDFFEVGLETAAILHGEDATTPGPDALTIPFEGVAQMGYSGQVQRGA
jgi:hypothetical protein